MMDMQKQITFLKTEFNGIKSRGMITNKVVIMLGSIIQSIKK